MDTELLWTLLPLAVVAADVVSIAVLVWKSQGVERTLAWLFAILAFPGFGAAAFFAFANPSVRRASRRMRRSSGAVREHCDRRDGPAKSLPALFTLAERATGFAPSASNRVTLLAENERAFWRIEQALESAERFIWAEYYIIRRDETGKRFLEILERRARAGVEVRLLFDAVGSMDLDSGRIRAIREAGGRAEAFHPLNPLKRRWAVHLRNHRKLVVADGEKAFTGGMNVGDEYSGRSRRRGGRVFHDTHMMLEGGSVADLAEVFAQDWAFATGEILDLLPEPEKAPEKSVEVAVLPSGPDQARNASALSFFALLGRARRTAYMTSPYFVPDETMLFAITCAAMRGVDVRLLVPARCDLRVVGYAARTYYQALLDAGVRVFEYMPSMLHAKTMVVDGRWSIVGSANLDIRSFRLNFELGALVRDPGFAGLLEKRFVEDIRKSREIDTGALAAQMVLTKAAQRLARLISPLL